MFDFIKKQWRQAIIKKRLPDKFPHFPITLVNYEGRVALKLLQDKKKQKKQMFQCHHQNYKFPL